ncbi:gag-polypeptide of LTR copia-type [Sesbania bispinosa]|nr:gag-polypeptide of LTR copia-type [Sesbania bispinosa]
MNLFGLGNGVVKFTGLNYADWSEQIQFQLGVFDLDLAIVMDEMPPAITETSTDDEKSLYEGWQRSNRMSLNLMRMTMAENVKPSMPKTKNAREFMKRIKEYSHSDITDKSIVGTLMTKLKSMGMQVNESFLVQFIMNSLPPEFGQFQVNYNTLKDKWNFQEIKAMLVQEEGRLKKVKDHSIHFMTHNGASSSKTKPRKKNKKDKGPMKGFLSIQPINGTEKYLYMGNRMKERIERIGTYRLILDTGCCLDVEKCLYVPGCARNLVSVAKLDCLGDGLYRFNLDVNFSESLFNVEQVVGSKRSARNECSAFLWHQRLGHISKERMLSTRIVESGNARFIENGQFSGSEESRKVDIQETTTNVSTPSVSSQVVIPLVVSQSHNMQRQQVNVPTPQNEHIDDEPTDNVQVTNDQVVEEPQEVALRSSVR